MRDFFFFLGENRTVTDFIFGIDQEIWEMEKSRQIMCIICQNVSTVITVHTVATQLVSSSPSVPLTLAV